MKAYIIGLGLALLNITFKIFPSGELLGILGAMILIDFATGVLKSYFAGVARTSSGFRQTVKKLSQYLVAIVLSMLVTLLGYVLAKFDLVWLKVPEYMQHLNSGVLIFIIYTELTSVLENVIEISPNSPISKYLFIPCHSLLTLELKSFIFKKLMMKRTDNQESL